MQKKKIQETKIYKNKVIKCEELQIKKAFICCTYMSSISSIYHEDIPVNI